MFYLIAITLLGISFAPLIIQKPDIWHAQGIFAQGCILLMFSCLFFEKPKYKLERNIPIGLLHLWIGIITIVICYQSQIAGRYDVKHFFPYFNFLCILAFYYCIGYLNRPQIMTILKWMRYVIIITLITCVIQKFGYSQYFALLEEPDMTGNTFYSIMVGFIGNGTHLSGFLASSAPLFLMENKRENWLALILMVMILCSSGTTIGNPSISGFIILGVITVYMIKTKPLALIGLFFWGSVILLVLWNKFPPDFFSPQGRVPIWTYYLDLTKQVAVTGGGLGAVNLVYSQTPFPLARHIHMEFLQFWFETGLIGLVLIINVIQKFLVIKAEDRTELCLKACVIGFLVSCCFNYPAHLWLPAVWVTFFYGAFLALKRKELRWV